MKFDIGAVFGQLVELYAKLPLAQKIAIPFLIAGSMATIVFVSRWASRPEYKVLFSDLEQADAAAVVERLKEQKIAYRLRSDGKTVDVSPPDIVHDLRLELAAAGLPAKASVGFEIFMEKTLGWTSFQENLFYVRGLQGELERTIGAIEAIKSVRVHITNPKRSAFVKRDILPTASVLLKLRAGEELTKQQLKGIANLVANSVERLEADNVSIVDSSGRLLNEKKGSENIQDADLTRLSYQRQLEEALVRRVESMLAEVLGAGRAVARVSAELDFNQYEREEEQYDPAGQVIRSESLTEEQAGLTAEGGIPGVISNLTNDPGVLTPPDSTQNSNLRSESIKNYEVSRAVSRTKNAAGEIERLSIGVLVDGQYESMPLPADAPKDAVPEKRYVPLSKEMLRKIDGLVKQAVGFDPTRGDTVTIENIQFEQEGESLEMALAASEQEQMLWKAASYTLPAFVAFMFFMFFVRPLVKFLISPSEAEVDLSRLLPAGIEELEAELEAERSKLSTGAEKVQPAIDIAELEELLQENSRMVADNPQQAALLIRYWINDGRM